MNFGSIAIDLVFLTSLGGMVLFLRKGFDPRSVFLFRLSALGTAAASVYLFLLLFTHRFEYNYVAEYSSRHQPLFYLISAFWAGQEGTFLLWALLVAAMGLVYARKPEEADAKALGLVQGFLAFLALIMIVKSPFATAVKAPDDGTGMNPLLQNFWMVIHPPILFVGYAATVFPFALALSALMRRDFSAWFAKGFRWTVFAAAMLGAGIIIGGFWAYEVLGWGGYWGWDPVENSSLVPWLTLLALIHGLVVQKAKGSLLRTNIFLAIMSFLLVLYATFLTRSGVLQDFSVHSFQDLGIGNYLIGIMVLTAAAGFGFFAARFGTIHPPKMALGGLTRELTLLLSIFVLCAGALFTFAGMSSPIITGIIGKASQVDVSFYNKVNLPVAIAMALLLGLTPFLGWSGENAGSLLKRFSLPLGLSALACVIAYVGGATTATLLLFIGASAFGLISNAIVSFRQYRSGWWNLGGPVAHMGTALLFIGIVGSGRFDETQRMTLRQGDTQSAFGYTFTFSGLESNDSLKARVRLEVSDGRTSFVALPRLYYSEYNRSVMREPDIRILPLKDIYISPIELTAPEAKAAEHPMLELKKGETTTYGGYSITFERFDVGQHGASAAMAVAAVLSVRHGGRADTVAPQLLFTQTGERQMVPVRIAARPDTPGDTSTVELALTQLSVEEKKILVEVSPSGVEAHNTPQMQLLLEVSIKPLMMVVWTGVVLIIAGSLLGFVRRLRVTEGSVAA